jgi:hypothetical protein
MRVIMPLFINDNEIDTSFLCQESKKYLIDKTTEQSIPKILKLSSLQDGLDFKKLKQIEEENADKTKGYAKTAKNRLIKSLLGLLVVALVLASVILFVPAVTAMATATIAAILAAGTFALPLLITAGVVKFGLIIVPSLIFAWKEYKNTRAHNKSMNIVTQLNSKLEDQSDSRNSENIENNVNNDIPHVIRTISNNGVGHNDETDNLIQSDNRIIIEEQKTSHQLRR